MDFDGNGNNDLAIGVDDWRAYGWNDAYDEYGRWMNGPLRGYVYIALNTGTNGKPVYARAEKILINGSPLQTYGWPSPGFADMDGDGDLDLICGELLEPSVNWPWFCVGLMHPHTAKNAYSEQSETGAYRMGKSFDGTAHLPMF